MCSTPRGSGTYHRPNPIQLDESDSDNYLKMLQQASSKFEAHEIATKQQQETAEKTSENHSK